MLAQLALGVTTVTTVAATGYAWRYRQQTLTDPLTGLANRAALQMAFRRHAAQGLSRWRSGT